MWFRAVDVDCAFFSNDLNGDVWWIDVEDGNWAFGARCNSETSFFADP